MDFGGKGKNTFLQKKKQQRKKTVEQQESRQKTIVIQKSIRAFLDRRTNRELALKKLDIRSALMLEADLQSYGIEAVLHFISKLVNEQPATQKIFFKRLTIACMKTSTQWDFLNLAVKIISDHGQIIPLLVRDVKFVNQLQKLLEQQKGSSILNYTIKQLVRTSSIKQLKPLELLKTALIQYRKDFLDIEGITSMNLSKESQIIIFQFLANEGEPTKQHLEIMNLEIMGKVILDLIKVEEITSIKYLCYLISSVTKLLLFQHENLVEKLCQKNVQFVHLIEDEEDLDYFENKIKQEEEYTEFSERTLIIFEKIFSHKSLLQVLIFEEGFTLKKQIDILISEMNKIYQGRKLVFIQNLLSSNETLLSSIDKKQPSFYDGLRLKLLTMDDDQFRNFNIFTNENWKEIIWYGILKAYQLNKKIVLGQFNQAKGVYNNKKLKPFMNRDEDEMYIKTLSQLLNNLHKKCLRTNKFPQSYFINEDLDKQLNTFHFGIGARAIEVMLKNFPFAFHFESRYARFKEFIKADKKNYDRSLFLQEEVDEDLIITVRRGNEFMDAFHACMARDLRKKYKIVFHNEQGLEEEGVDGGGIIKQFINRVLKVSFGNAYGLFYENQQHEILPNPYSPLSHQYQFVGKILGKAVYEGINIEQKFAQPFLNLLIGRQNTFEDLQYIDKGIFRSLIQIKNMEEDIASLEQTFTILDQLPNGMKRYINLKNPLIPPTEKTQILVTNDNKLEFVMNYSDFKCNKQLEEKTRLFRKGFLKVMKSEWLSMFNNQELNLIISGSHADYSVEDLMYNSVFNGYHGKDETIGMLWQVVKEFSLEEKAQFLFFVTSCSRPPTLGFSHLKPLFCVQRSDLVANLPTANTCMNILRLPNYKNKAALKEKLLYAIKAKAGFEFA